MIQMISTSGKEVAGSLDMHGYLKETEVENDLSVGLKMGSKEKGSILLESVAHHSNTLHSMGF